MRLGCPVIIDASRCDSGHECSGTLQNHSSNLQKGTNSGSLCWLQNLARSAQMLLETAPKGVKCVNAPAQATAGCGG